MVEADKKEVQVGEQLKTLDEEASQEAEVSSSDDMVKDKQETDSQETEGTESSPDPMEVEKQEMMRIEKDFEVKTARVASMLKLPAIVNIMK